MGLVGVADALAAKIGGTNVACTGVTPMPPRPPQKARLLSLGEVGRSFCVFGVRTGEDEAVAGVGASVGVCGGDTGTGGSSAGGGRSGRARPSRRHFLSAVISWRRAMFSDLDEPSSDRMASIRRSRSAMSPSSVVMYSE